MYVGNLPTKLNVTIFKEKFPTAKRIDIGYAQRTKFTRYAFLHYDNVEESMEAFKSTYNLTIDARSLVVRFRRNKGSVGLSEKGKKTKKVIACRRPIIITYMLCIESGNTLKSNEKWHKTI